MPPAEFEQLHAVQGAIAGNGSVAPFSPKPADRPYARPVERERASRTLNGTLMTDGAEPGPADAGPASHSLNEITNNNSRDTVQ